MGDQKDRDGATGFQPQGFLGHGWGESKRRLPGGGEGPTGLRP